MFKLLAALGRDNAGATAVEYGLILALVFLAMIGSVQAFGTNLIGLWNTTADTTTTAMGS